MVVFLWGLIYRIMGKEVRCFNNYSGGKGEEILVEVGYLDRS